MPAWLAESLDHGPADFALAAVAHRIVHGGESFAEPVVLDETRVLALEKLAALAPLHQPFNLAGVRACMQAFPGVPQVGCFDTAFHQSLGPLETGFALPQGLREQGIRRYGFHGLSYAHMARQLPELSVRARGRVLMAHLGNGASLCAIQEGRSVSTTMGFSTLDGLIMGSRSGTIDPGVLLYLLQQGWDEPRLTHLLYRQSGLLGVSGESADMRALRRSTSASARHAIDLFVHRIHREGGAMMTLMKGVDAVVFTGGIGQHDPCSRAEIADGWRIWGMALDASANQVVDGTSAARIEAPGSAVEVWVVPADEGREAARQAASLLKMSQ
ncbi:MAG: acetate/propionate family kinase [Limnohabitans sp.]